MILIIGGPLCAGAATYTWSVCGHSLSLSKAVWFWVAFLRFVVLSKIATRSKSFGGQQNLEQN